MTSKTWTLYLTSGFVTAIFIALMMEMGNTSGIVLSCEILAADNWRNVAVAQLGYIFSAMTALFYTVGLLRHHNNIKPYITNYILLYQAPFFWILFHAVIGFIYYCGRF